MVLCATPEYLKVHGNPGQVSELAGHPVLAYTLLSMGEFNAAAPMLMIAGEGPLLTQTRVRSSPMAMRVMPVMSIPLSLSQGFAASWAPLGTTSTSH